MLNKFATSHRFHTCSQMDQRAVHTNGMDTHQYLSKHISIQSILIAVGLRRCNSKTDQKLFMTMLMICLEIHYLELSIINLLGKLHLLISKTAYVQPLQWALKIRSQKISLEARSHKKHNMERKLQFLKYLGTIWGSQILTVKDSQILDICLYSK